MQVGEFEEPYNLLSVNLCQIVPMVLAVEQFMQFRFNSSRQS